MDAAQPAGEAVPQPPSPQRPSEDCAAVPVAGQQWRGLRTEKVVPLSAGDRPPLLVVSRGSVVDFDGDAIVNAANEGCQGGGGVDGVISRLGGPDLAKARLELPTLPGKRSVRCLTGDAVITIGGRLKAPWCIHAVGPIYGMTAPLSDCDVLVRSAYCASLRCAERQGLETVAFSLISAGIFRGEQSLDKVLAAGIAGIVDGLYPGLREVHVVGFTGEELHTLLDVAARPLPTPLPRSTTSSFAPGQRVRVTGLANKPEMNGQIGVLQEFFPEKGRWKVVIEGVEDGTSLSITEKNLEALGSAEPAPGVDAISEEEEEEQEEQRGQQQASKDESS